MARMIQRTPAAEVFAAQLSARSFGELPARLRVLNPCDEVFDAIAGKTAERRPNAKRVPPFARARHDDSAFWFSPAAFSGELDTLWRYKDVTRISRSW